MPAGEKFVNQAYLSVVESAANTLTFSKLETGISIYEKVGWLISRLDYHCKVLGANFAAEGDSITYGISVSDSISSISLSLAAIVDQNEITRMDFGTAGSGLLQVNPRSKTFADLPGGGILVPPNPIYICVKGTALTSAITIYARMFYTVVELKGEEFWELVEQRRMIGA